MKLRAPAGCASVSHGGRVFRVEADGTIEVEDENAEAFAAHGFVLCGEASLLAVSETTREELIGQVMELTLRMLQTSTMEIIRGRLAELQAAKPLAQADTDAAVATREHRVVDPDGLKRSELFALLRERGVKVRIPITNVDLRALAKRTLAAPA